MCGPLWKDRDSESQGIGYNFMNSTLSVNHVKSILSGGTQLLIHSSQVKSMCWYGRARFPV
jgi:hypothetical protein